MKNLYRIADISLGKCSNDACYEFEYQGKHFEVQRFGANFSVPYMRDLIVNFRNQVDAIAISDMPTAMSVGGRSYIHRQYLEVMSQPTSVPLCDGSRVREIAGVRAISEAIEKGEIDPKLGIFFPMALLSLEIIDFLRKDHHKHLFFGDAYSLLGLPWVASMGPGIQTATRLVLGLANLKDIKSQTPMPLTKLKKLARPLALAQLEKIRYVYGDIGIITVFGKDTRFVEGKDVLLTQSTPNMVGEILKHKPRSVTNLFPKEFLLSPYINYSVLDAVLRLANNQAAPLSLEEWFQLLSQSTRLDPQTKRYVTQSRTSTQARAISQVRKIRQAFSRGPAPDFAFVVHALSSQDLFRIPGLKQLENLPPHWRDSVEKFASKAPGFTYGHIRHILSTKNNREVNGIIYGLMSTPKMMKQEDPEATYEKIEKLCHHAAHLGAKIIGLGAYTKVVGDSGATINRNSPIPVTTGNSLSAAATLWAVRDVALQMKLLKPAEKSSLIDGTAMVIGATGSIGKVSAKLLSLAFKKIILVAPRINRLEELAIEIKALNPQCEVFVSVSADELAHKADVLVTATSALDQKVVDVEKLKPGCIVCDCSRPLDFDINDAMKRPDITIIESGEVILPGPVELTCDLGLPDNSVYACLGETAVLAMEGLYESFTLGRDIDWQKVKTIYKLSLEHGVKLAAIRGHAGFITPKEIALTRELALKKLSLPIA